MLLINYFVLNKYKSKFIFLESFVYNFLADLKWNEQLKYEVWSLSYFLPYLISLTNTEETKIMTMKI